MKTLSLRCNRVRVPGQGGPKNLAEILCHGRRRRLSSVMIGQLTGILPINWARFTSLMPRVFGLHVSVPARSSSFSQRVRWFGPRPLFRLPIQSCSVIQSSRRLALESQFLYLLYLFDPLPLDTCLSGLRPFDHSVPQIPARLCSQHCFRLRCIQI